MMKLLEIERLKYRTIKHLLNRAGKQRDQITTAMWLTLRRMAISTKQRIRSLEHDLKEVYK